VAEGNWEKLPALNSLYSPACVAVGDKLYVSGGTLRDKSHSAALHKYDFFKGRWLHLPPMSVPRASHGFLACNQKLYALGGCGGFEDYLDSAECFDLMEKTWTPISRLPLALSCSASATLKDKLYLIGGERKNYLFPEMYKGVLIYDVNSGIWTQVPLAVACCSAGAVPMNNGIYVIGGYSKERMRHLPVSEDGRMDEDVVVPELPRGIAGAGVVQWERRIYVLGGENCWVYTNPNVHNESPGTYYDTIYFWEPSHLTWTECPENLPIVADGVSGFGPLAWGRLPVLGPLPRVPLTLPSCSPHPAPDCSSPTLPQHSCCCCSASSSPGCSSGPSPALLPRSARALLSP
uniref:Uncharacterized protein n=1 Tax=Chrysemys picta bellii TaxID=8478 RepID=A0A8C3FU64_CHRPI